MPKIHWTTLVVAIVVFLVVLAGYHKMAKK